MKLFCWGAEREVSIRDETKKKTVEVVGNFIELTAHDNKSLFRTDVDPKDVGIALVREAIKLEEELFQAKRTIWEQDKIIASLKAEIGKYLREEKE